MRSGARQVAGAALVLFLCACSQKQEPASAPAASPAEPVASQPVVSSAGQIETAVVDFKPVQPRVSAGREDRLW